MRRETELFVEHIVREDRSILDFLDGRYTFLNERLARHYGIAERHRPRVPPRRSRRTRRAAACSRRRSVLTVSSYATRTSPVLRGKWILDNLLDAPPPEPPPDVPNLDETKIGTAASVRQQLEQHRKNPTCASCHRRMDPLGFGLENFDAVGAWRTMDGKFADRRVGHAARRPRRSTGPEELRAILRRPSATRSRARITGKLLTYALGRGLERYDRRDGEDDRGQPSPPSDYRFSSLVLEIVNSLPSRCGAPSRSRRRQPSPADTRTAQRHPAPVRIGRRDRRTIRRSQHDDHHRQAPVPPHVPERHGRRSSRCRCSTR